MSSSSVVASIRNGVPLRTVKVSTKGGTYDVVVGRDICTSTIFANLVEEVCTDPKQRVTKFFIFVDSNLLGLNSGLVTSVEVALASIVGGDKVSLYCVPSGEASKCRDQKVEIEDWLSQNGADRRAVLVALGGGVIGDLIGFVAASYYRGIRFIQVPTTVLSMVDSSVGGKTAVDTGYGKNLIGAFWQPILVVADIAVLDTLPIRQTRSGIAEIIKAGMCSRADLFAELESTLSSKGVEGLIQDTERLRDMIVAGIDYKRSVVEEDERDTGIRNELNWGHTVGHAIEGMGVTGLHHGECVSIGMVYEAMALRARGQLSNIAVQRLEKVLKCCDLPTFLPPGAAANQQELMRRMKRDKKNRGGAIHVVNVKEIGRCEGDSRTVAVPERILQRVLSSAVTIDPSALKSGQKLGPPGGVVELPGSKSISNRALVLAALAEKPQGKCRVLNLTPSEDIRVMLAALAKLGVDVKYLAEGPDSGLNVELKCPEGALALRPDASSASVTTVWAENAGTVARFITPVLAYLVATSKDPSAAVVVDGNERMRVRPVRDLVDCIQRAFEGVKVEYQGNTEGCLPLRITKSRKRSVPDASEGQASSGFPCGTVELSSKVSSQFVSGMLLVSSLARGGEAAKEGFTLLLEDTHGGKAVSQPYIDMTCRVMEAFGVKALPLTDAQGRLSYKVAAGQKLVAPSSYMVEADASAASYPLAIAAATGSEVTVNLPYQSPGSQPLQGDSLFVSRILQPMGCKIERSKDGWTTVTGPPAGKLNAIGSVDMSDLTDSFLTAAVLMALAEGESSITNVANQWVKECDRIAAMAQNINLCFHSKVAEERPDGLVIRGGSPVAGFQPVTTESHDDHRVAMSMAVLATRFPAGSIRISQPRCVEKTFSDFWDVLELQLGIPVSGVTDVEQGSCGDGDVTMGAVERQRDFSPRKVFLIGMRNCGKTTIGRELATDMNWRFLDMDAELEQRLGMALTEFVKQQGWKEFRKAELQLLHSILEDDDSQCIVSCGGGIVELPQAVSILAQQRYVVWLKMDEDDVVAANTGPDGKPAYGEPVERVYGRRRDKFAEASSYEIHLPRRPAAVDLLPGHVASCRSMAVSLLQAWLKRVDLLGNDGRPPLPGKYSTFTCLTLPSYDVVKGRDADLEGTSAVEVRLDLLKDPADSVRQLQYASIAAGELPIIATLRSASEGGKFDESDERYWDLIQQVSRSCSVSYVDIEISRCSESFFPAPVPGVGYLASEHFLRPPTGGRLEVCRAFDEVLQPWWSAVGKVVFTASTESDANLVSAVQAEKLRQIAKPSIGLCMGPCGTISRVTNPFWTPVRHPAMKAAAPGQLSLKELRTLREASHIGTTAAEKQKKKFFVLGSPVAKSPSPALHNHIFKTLGLPHEYSRLDTSSLDDVLSLMAQDDFGGASITIPLKEKVFHAVSGGAHGRVSELALSAQAVNTIVKHDDGSLSFHNTDTLALAESIRTKAALASTCLVVGTGGAARGACAAAELLGMEKLFVWGRDSTKAAKLAQDFVNGQVCPTDPGTGSFDVIIGCVPAGDAQVWPQWWFSKDTLILEMAYIPQKTPLTRTAGELGCRNIVYGLEILVLQGIEQSMLWTGMPREAFGNDVYGPVVQFYAQTSR